MIKHKTRNILKIVFTCLVITFFAVAYKQSVHAVPKVTNDPYFVVNGGDVVVGGASGFTGANGCTTDLGAGIMAFNDGPVNPPASTDAIGSGTNLADLAPDLITGFASSNSYGPNTVANALSFANDAGPIDGGDFGATLPSACSQDYFDLSTSPNVPKSGGVFEPMGGNGFFYINKPGAGECNPVTTNGVTVQYCSQHVDTHGTNTGDNGTNDPHLNICLATTSTASCGGQPYTPQPFTGHMVLFVDGDVEIEQNILLAKSGAWTKVSDIPTFTLIVSGDIYLDDNGDHPATTSSFTPLTELDGTYIAEPNADDPAANTQANSGGTLGNIYDCTSGHGQWQLDGQPNNTSYTPSDDSEPGGNEGLFSNCNYPLTVDGAMVANEIRLDRTYGSVVKGAVGGSPNNPAETFNYTPWTWLFNPLVTSSALPTTPVYNAQVQLSPVL